MDGSLLDILRKPLMELSGTPVSALSVLTALLVVLVAHLISRVVARSLTKAFQNHPGVGFTVGKITRWAGMVIGVLIALTTVGLNMSAVFAAMAVLLVGIGFGLQKMAENFISGLILLVERPLSIGHFIQVDAFKGTVKDIGLRATRIETEEGLMHLIPNGELITKTVTNYTLPSQTVEITVQVGVSYDVDLQMVRKVLLEIADASPRLCKDPAPEVRHRGFGDSSIDLALEGWIERAHEDDDIKSDLRFAIAAKFAELGIEIPYPQRDIRTRAMKTLGA
jgi:small-conductance mechanosensitive channel